MPFRNRIRLPFKLTRPQYPKDKTIFTYADGSSKVLSVQVHKTYEGETDYFSEKMHERLVIALEHDSVVIEGDKYLGSIVSDGDYTIDWQKFLDYPKGKSSFTVLVTPFNANNNNCKTCEEVTQLDLTNDQFPDPLEEGGTYEINVADNDNICCYPSVFSIVDVDSRFIQSVTIDANGLLTIIMKSSFTTTGNIKLLTYKVSCPNGSFDTADVYGQPEGEAPTCAAPDSLTVLTKSATTASIGFTPGSPAPDHYYWKLYKVNVDTTTVFIEDGDTAGSPINLSSLVANTNYKLFLRSQCDGTDNDDPASDFIELDFITNPNTGQCGQYILGYFAVFGPSTRSATYLDCNGNTQTISIPKNGSKTICAMQTSHGVPVSIIRDYGIMISPGDDSVCGAGSDFSTALEVGTTNLTDFPFSACSNMTTVYVSSDHVDIEEGVTVYLDAGLTLVNTGIRYITDTEGRIYDIISGTVISFTGLTCP